MSSTPEQWKIRRELSRLQLDIAKMQNAVSTYTKRINKRFETLKNMLNDYEKPTNQNNRANPPRKK